MVRFDVLTPPLVKLVFTTPLAPVDDAVAMSDAAVSHVAAAMRFALTHSLQIVGAAPVLSSAVAARATRVLNESLDTAVANDQLNRAPFLVFENSSRQ